MPPKQRLSGENPSMPPKALPLEKHLNSHSWAVGGLFVVVPAVLGCLVAVGIGLRPVVQAGSGLGAVSASEASVYVQAPPMGTSCSGIHASVLFRQAGDVQGMWSTSGSTGLVGGAEMNMRTCAAIVHLKKLSPATKYEYVVTESKPQSGTFKTLTSPGTPVKFTATISSCLVSWGLTSAYSLSWLLPTDVFMLIGDAIYADVPFNFLSSYEDLYLRLVQDVNFAALSSRVPVLAMYDDHEVWDNWNKKEAEPFPQAQGNWSFFLGNRNPPPLHKGVKYFTYTNGDACFFVADVRRYRDEETHTLLGQKQLTDLISWLSWSNGCKLRVLVTPVPMVHMEGKSTKSHLLANDAWDNFENERSLVLATMVKAGNPVLVVSGDSHWAGVYELEGGIVEISASPLFQMFLSPWSTGVKFGKEPNFISSLGLHYAELHVDTVGAPGVPPSVEVEIHGSFLGLLNPSVVWAQKYNLTDLIPRGPAPAFK